MKRKKQETEADILAQIDEDFARWDKIMAEGCQDPFWPDGVNLNLKRNHIIYGYKKLAEVMQGPVQLTLFDTGFDMSNLRPVPPVVPHNYMVKAGEYAEIRISRMIARGEEPVFEF